MLELCYRVWSAIFTFSRSLVFFQLSCFSVLCVHVVGLGRIDAIHRNTKNSLPIWYRSVDSTAISLCVDHFWDSNRGGLCVAPFANTMLPLLISALTWNVLFFFPVKRLSSFFFFLLLASMRDMWEPPDSRAIAIKHSNVNSSDKQWKRAESNCVSVGNERNSINLELSANGNGGDLREDCTTCSCELRVVGEIRQRSP